MLCVSRAIIYDMTSSLAAATAAAAAASLTLERVIVEDGDSNGPINLNEPHNNSDVYTLVSGVPVFKTVKRPTTVFDLQCHICGHTAPGHSETSVLHSQIASLAHHYNSSCWCPVCHIISSSICMYCV
jgi:hypothetical protein